MLYPKKVLSPMEYFEMILAVNYVIVTHCILLKGPTPKYNLFCAGSSFFSSCPNRFYGIPTYN